MAMSEGTRSELSFKLSTLFRPTTPINREDLFAGRAKQTSDVIGVINQPGQHALLYGERGVGKTSLANMIFPKLHCAAMPILAPHINCMSDDDFGAIWKRIAREILEQADGKREIEISERLRQILQDATDGIRQIDVDLCRSLLMELGQTHIVVCIIDEFDTVADFGTRRRMADAIKFLSDRNVPATLVLIGVSEDVESLIENHRSVERCLHQIHMPRMSRDELEIIISKPFVTCGMEIEESALHEMSRLARGLPHYAHLLGMHAGHAAIEKGQTKVKEKHVNEAAKRSLTHAQHSVQADYNLAVTSSRDDAQYREVLLACAMAKADDLGFFYPKDVRTPLMRVLKRVVKGYAFQRYLKAFCLDDRGMVLVSDESTSRPRYRFANPLLEPYIVIRGLAEGLITEDDLRDTRDKKDQRRLF